MSAGLNVQSQAGNAVEPPLPLERLDAAVRFVLEQEGIRNAEISITLLSDEEIAGMNEEYLQHQGPTDVISFPLETPDGSIVGDVYLGAAQAVRQARELGEDPMTETLRLAIHGTLHVLGYDHPKDDDRQESPMFQRQEELLALFLGDQ